MQDMIENVRKTAVRRETDKACAGLIPNLTSGGRHTPLSYDQTTNQVIRGADEMQVPIYIPSKL